MSLYSGPPKKFLGQKIEKDAIFDQAQIRNQFRVPLISSANLPPQFLVGQGGGLAYDVVTKQPFYSNGTTWIPIATALPTGNVQTYSFTTTANQIIAPLTDTVITMWTIAGPPPVYHTLPQWDLATGVYTATQATEKVCVAVDICWAAGISNLGDRTLRIEYQANASIIWQIASESVIQAEPKTAVESPQSCELTLLLSLGDKVRVAVFHTALGNLQIAGGVHTSMTGFRSG